MKGKIRDKIPEIEKNIEEFIKDESGIVTKDNILKTGIILGFSSLALASLSAAADHTSHTNEIGANVNAQAGTATGTHSHHGQHTSY